MFTISFNKDNWTGEEAVVKFDEYNLEFTLDHMTEEFFLTEINNEDGDIIFYVFLKEKTSNLRLGTVFLEVETQKAGALSCSGNLERFHKGEYAHFIAAAKLVCSLL